MQNRSSRSASPPREPAADEAETEMGGDRSSETSEDAFKSNPEKGSTTGKGKPTERWKEAQDVEHAEGVPKTRSRQQGGPDAAMPDNMDK
ncbi:MAG TPA: hypothetical protein VH105_25785 [Burkholderiales bacterium]|nr:hypothetical protein [Burkholderiales bacterium]